MMGAEPRQAVYRNLRTLLTDPSDPCPQSTTFSLISSLFAFNSGAYIA
jgi:hypothetical protein